MNIGQTVFWWFGVEDTLADGESDVLQPVLGWHPSGSWEWVPWNCCPHGHQLMGDVLHVKPGDELIAEVVNTGGTSYDVICETADGRKSV